MSWFDKFEDLFKRKVPQSEFEAIFQRMDFEQFFNSVRNLWSPSELIKKMGGYENLHLLYKDHDIYASIDKRIAALLNTEMQIEGPDEALVQFFEEQLRHHERQLKQDFWWAIYNGWAVEQIIYDEDRSGKVVGFQREDFWRFEPQKDLIHAKLVSSNNTVWRNKIVPYGKFVLTTNNGTSSNPYGDAMAERLVLPYIFKCNGWDLWQDFAKRFANGFMHGKIEDMSQAAAMRSALEKAGKSSIFVTDKNTELNLVTPNRDSSIYSTIDDKTVRAIQKVILGETQTSDMAERGSSGSAGVQNEVRQEKTWADIDLVSKSLNETIRQIAAVNGFNPDLLPTVTLSWDPDFSIEQSTRDVALYGMGVRFTEEYYKKTYGLKDDDFEIDNTPPQPSFGFAQKRGTGKTFLTPDEMKSFMGVSPSKHKCNVHLNASDSRKSSRRQQETEEIVSLLSRNSDAPINPDDLVAAILSAKDEDDLEIKLTSLFDQRNNGFVDDMTKGLYLAAARGAMFGNPETLKKDEFDAKSDKSFFIDKEMNLWEQDGSGFKKIIPVK